jgi:lipoprotein-anchoring transpeptidase ErfK/SrfK
VRSRSFVAVVALLVVMIGGAAAIVAYDAGQRDVIAHGVTVGAVDVGGLSASQARARLAAAYRVRLRRPIVLRFRDRRFVLTPSESKLAIDVPGTVVQAVSESRSANIFSRVWRSLTGGRIDVHLAPQITFRSTAVDQFVARVASAINRPATDAHVSFTGDSLGTVDGSPGLAVRAAALSSAITQALTSARRAPIEIPVAPTRPQVSTSQLAARYPTVITIDRSAFALRLWKHLRLVRRYTIAVGRAGLETPAGLYHVQDKQVDPSWHVPNSAWAGSLAGQTIPPGPSDPLKARWMGIYNGAGIHGTDALSSLGTAASHGCIRMAIPDVIELYGQTPLGSPVYIA